MNISIYRPIHLRFLLLLIRLLCRNISGGINRGTDRTLLSSNQIVRKKCSIKLSIKLSPKRHLISETKEHHKEWKTTNLMSSELYSTVVYIKWSQPKTCRQHKRKSTAAMWKQFSRWKQTSTNQSRLKQASRVALIFQHQKPIPGIISPGRISMWYHKTSLKTEPLETIRLIARSKNLNNKKTEST